MGLQDCQIILDNSWNTYYAGQTVNGQVKLQLNSTKSIRGKFYLSMNVDFIICAMFIFYYSHFYEWIFSQNMYIIPLQLIKIKQSN